MDKGRRKYIVSVITLNHDNNNNNKWKLLRKQSQTARNLKYIKPHTENIIFQITVFGILYL